MMINLTISETLRISRERACDQEDIFYIFIHWDK